MNWKPVADPPKTSEPLAAVIATRDPDEEGWYLLSSVYLWRQGKFVDEDALEPLPEGEYFYVLESEVLEGLPA